MYRELEICAETLQACEAAQGGGADRIELCAALSEGGVTPGVGFLREALAAVSIPVHALVRPRSGNFTYSAAEFRMVCADAESALSLGASGIVVGMLTPERTVDRVRINEIMRIASGRPVTFHRAFDLVADLSSSLEIVIDLGCSRVLTSGGEPTVMQGWTALQQLCVQSAGRIRIAAGGGVTLENTASLLQIDGLDLHGSLRKKAAASSAVDVLWQDADRSVDAGDVKRLSAIVHAAG